MFLNSLFSLLDCIYIFIHSAAQHGMWKPSSPTKDKIPYPLHWKLRSPSDRDLNPGSLAPASINLIYYPTLRLGTILSESPSSTKGEFRAVLRGSKCSQCQGQSRLQGRGENSVFLRPNVKLSPLQLQQVQSGLKATSYTCISLLQNTYLFSLPLFLPGPLTLLTNFFLRICQEWDTIYLFMVPELANGTAIPLPFKSRTTNLFQESSYTRKQSFPQWQGKSSSPFLIPNHSGWKPCSNESILRTSLCHI